MPPKPERIQIDDHFAAARARANAPKPRIIGVGRALLLLVALGAAIAGTWWWALQPTGGGRLFGNPSAPTTVADRQALVAARMTDDERGPRLGGEPEADYQARLARIRQRDEAAGAAPGGATGATASPATPTATAYGPPDSSANLLASRVNEQRGSRCGHLWWLDDCERRNLVALARQRVANTTGSAQHAEEVAAKNLAADIDTHQREARRIDGLLDVSEPRLVKYCVEHRCQLPPLDNPPTSPDPKRSIPRPALKLPVDAPGSR